jgi:chromosome segregation ATPase
MAGLWKNVHILRWALLFGKMLYVDYLNFIEYFRLRNDFFHTHGTCVSNLKNQINMLNKNNRISKLLITGFCTLLILTSCNQSGKQDENIQQLLDRQAEIEDRKEESVNTLFNLRDSLATEKELLISQRDSQQDRITRMEKDQQMLVDQLKESEVQELSSLEGELRDRIESYEDSIAFLKKEISQLNTYLDSIEASLKYYEVQEERTGVSLESGIEEIDRRMDQRDARKELEMKNVEMLRKRVNVAQKKKDAFNLERQMYVDELDELLRENASAESKAPYEAKVHELDSIITSEQSNINNLRDEIAQAETFIAETDALMAELKEQVRMEYDRKEIIESFIVSEKERLELELKQLQQTRSKLLTEQTSINENLAATQRQIEKINRDVELIRNRKMSEILQQQAEIEQSEARLAEEEIKLLDDPPNPLDSLFAESYVPGDSFDKELISLLKMGDQLDSMQQMIQEEKTEIAKTRKELSEQRAEVASRRAKLGKTAGYVVIILLLGGVGVLYLFYYLGRRSKKSRQSGS